MQHQYAEHAGMDCIFTNEFIFKSPRRISRNTMNRWKTVASSNKLMKVIMKIEYTINTAIFEMTEMKIARRRLNSLYRIKADFFYFKLKPD